MAFSKLSKRNCLKTEKKVVALRLSISIKKEFSFIKSLSSRPIKLIKNMKNMKNQTLLTRKIKYFLEENYFEIRNQTQKSLKATIPVLHLEII